jgi:hypothetical protein
MIFICGKTEGLNMRSHIVAMLCWSALLVLVAAETGCAAETQAGNDKSSFEIGEQYVVPGVEQKEETAVSDNGTQAVDGKSWSNVGRYFITAIIVSLIVATIIAMWLVHRRQNSRQKSGPIFPTAEISHRPFPLEASDEELEILMSEREAGRTSNESGGKAAQNRAA